MAVQCGFFNSVNKDRLYQAEDMTRPYELLISNGVFATPQGTPSDYLQVVADTGMNVKVKAGRGLFADKWLINDSEMVLTFEQSEVVLNRIDSVMVKIDTSEEVRAGTIYIKKGTPATTPTAPVVERTENVTEYRLADVAINAGVSSIVQANITDQRGSADCPWITSLIKQVDTSTLLAQWQDLYQTYYNDTDALFDQFYEDSNQTFDEWFANLKQTVATQTLIRTFTSYYVTQIQDESVIPVDITQYNSELDILQVFVNGLLLVPTLDYTIASNPASQITLTKPLDIGQTVSFIVYKSVDGSSAETIVSQVEELQNILDASKLTNDTGGVKLSLASGDLLARFKELGKGFHTILASNAVTNIPEAGQYFRCFGHITDVPYGWIIAVGGNGKTWVNFATGESSWIGWKELTNSNDVTNATGGTKLTLSDTSKNVLTEFANAGTGFHTIYSVAGVQGTPAQGAFRHMGHLTGTGNGWIMAFQANGSVYSNYLVGGAWKGWRVIFDSNPSALWTGASFMNETANITPSKRLSECAHGWVLVWSDYNDETSSANTYDNVTTIVPKLNGVENDWNGSSLLCMLPTDVTAEGVATTCVKRIYIYDDHITGFAGHNVGDSARDVVLRAIYEY